MSAGEGARVRIEAAHRYGAIYRNGLASHHPMAIAALDAMGASDADMDRFEARYLPQLEPLQRAVVAIQPGDEAAHLGSPRAFAEWVVYFDAAKNLAWTDPRLVLSPAAAADGYDITLTARSAARASPRASPRSGRGCPPPPGTR